MPDYSIIYSAQAPIPMGPYSQALKTPNAIYLSGQIPVTADLTFIDGSIGEKTRQCISNLAAVLQESGSSLEKVVKVTVFLINMDDFDEMNEEYAKWFKHKPARSCIAVKALPKKCDVEIEVVALP